MSLWSFQVSGYAIWANQCTGYVLVLHEPHIQGSVEEIDLDFLRPHLGLQQDMEGHMRHLDEVLNIMEAQ